MNTISKNTISKQTAALLCAICMLAPVPSALAWSEVCMSTRGWLKGEFTVIYGFSSTPQKARVNRSGQSYQQITSDARGWTQWSPASWRCLSIRHVRPGEKIAVYMLPQRVRIDQGVICETDDSNPNAFYVQNDRQRRLWYRVSGHVWNPQCKFSGEE